jgi:segregation and condensation protein B
MEFLQQHIEALIFATPEPVRVKDILSVLDEAFEDEVKKEAVEEAIEAIEQKFKDPAYAFELVFIAGGYQFMTKGAYHNIIAIHLKQTTKKRLSQAAMETLAIVAYKQPVTKSDLEAIRGVNCDYAIQKLLEKELVQIMGRSETPGRPLLYETSDKFMDYLGIKGLQDLPKPKDFKEVENTIGEASSTEEPVPPAEDED